MGWWSGLVRAVRSAVSRRGTTSSAAPRRQLATIDALIDRMTAIGEGLQPDDGLAAFNTMYLRVTRLVRERIAAGSFLDSAYMTRLDIVFGSLYLAAVDAAGDTTAADTPALGTPGPTTRPNAAWAPVFECRREAGRVPIQFALAGMNAHINHDLAVAVVETCRQLGTSPSSGGVETDYQRITDLLAQVQQEVRQSFLDGPLLQIDQRCAAPLANLVGTWSIGRARDAAWTNALVLWQLQDASGLRDEFLATLSRTVGMTGRLLLTPLDEML